MKDRISLRKRGLPIPSETEAKESSHVGTARAKAKRKQERKGGKEGKEENEEGAEALGDIDEADIISALLRNEEVICDILIMQVSRHSPGA